MTDIKAQRDEWLTLLRAAGEAAKCRQKTVSLDALQEVSVQSVLTMAYIEMERAPHLLDRAVYTAIEKLDWHIGGSHNQAETANRILCGEPLEIPEKLSLQNADLSCYHAWVNWLSRALDVSADQALDGFEQIEKRAEIERAILTLLPRAVGPRSKLPPLWRDTFSQACLDAWDMHKKAAILSEATPTPSQVHRSPRL